MSEWKILQKDYIPDDIYSGVYEFLAVTASGLVYEPALNVIEIVFNAKQGFIYWYKKRDLLVLTIA